MKGKSHFVRIVGVILVFTVLVASIFKGKIFLSASDAFVNLVYEGEVESLMEKELEDYEKMINKELNILKNRKDLEQIYFALGKIASLEGKYDESNNYLLNAASFIKGEYEVVDALIYETLATNSLALQDVEGGYQYFEEANNQVYELGDPQLAISLYSHFSDALVEHTRHTSFPVYLLSEAVQLSKESPQKVILMAKLAHVYDLNGFKDLSVSELMRALNMSVKLDNKELQIEIMNRLIRFYFGAHQYEETDNMLNQYFELASYDPVKNYDMLWVWLQTQYRLYGYQGFEDALDVLSVEYPEVAEDEEAYIQWFICFNQSYFLLLEKRFEECKESLTRLEAMRNDEEISELVSLLIGMVKLDLNYEMKTEGIDYTLYYQELLKELYLVDENLGITNLVIPQVLSRLLELEDYKTVYQYTSYLKDPLDQELEAMNALRDMIQKSAQREQQFHSSFPQLVLKYGGYVVATLFGIGLTYAGYQYNRYFTNLKRRVKESGVSDTLTHTLTKKALYEKLELELEQNKMYYFLLLDINDFKAYNEDFGYLAGDRVLIEMAKLLKEFFENSYISRHYGHHFIIVVKDIEEKQLIKRIDCMLEEIRQSEKISAKREITCCIGISKGHLTNTIDIDEQINSAAKKLKISKQRGKGIYTL